MSQFKEFQSSEAFREQLKKFLLTEHDVENKNEPVVQSQRYSFDVQPDLQKTIDDKLKESGKKFKLLENDNGDDSFAALERICNKTVSDPESTLYEYMHSDCKAKALQIIKKRQSEEEAAHRDLGCLAFDAKMLNNDVTQLADIEEPSKFWENTMSSLDSMLLNSPVKMVGLMRPSTIAEECDEDEYTRTSLPTTSYETAQDTTSSTQAKNEFFSLANSVTKTTESPATSSEDSIIEISDNEEDTMATKRDSFNTDDGGMSDILNLTASTYNMDEEEDKENVDQENASFEFNDTLEKVDYMMKKGLAIMAAKQQEEKKPIIEIKHVSPKLEQVTPNTCKTKDNASAKKTTPRYELNLKPPKFELFKRPLAGGSATKSSIFRKANFDHVKSPIGMYINKTGTTPLMSTIKTINHERESRHTAVFRNLEHSDFRNSPPAKKEDFKNMQKQDSSRLLPKKAYISSQLKHVVDERTAITVPGGHSIQQYIMPALLPAVIRHEGKVRLNDKAKKTTHDVDDSLKDLSIMSGDVSVYTIKDARKF